MNSTRLSLSDLTAFDSGTHRGDESRFCCPLPECEMKSVDAEHRSLCVNRVTGYWICHRCDARGRLLGVGQPTRGVHLALSPREHGQPRRHVLPWTSLPIRHTRGEMYLRRRGIRGAVAERAGALWVPNCFGRPAVAVLLRDERERCVGTYARYIDAPAEPGDDRVVHRISGHKSLGVYATPGARAAEVVAVAESVIDAMSLSSVGFSAIALCGTTWPSWLPRRLAFKRVLVATDADEAGDKAAESMMRVFGALGAKCSRLRPMWKDWNDTINYARPR